jgi:O-antigen/teichoic acid export membrane protein
MLIFTYFCFQFIFRVINTILTADQQPAKASLIDMLGQLMSLAIIFLLTRVTNGSLLYLGLAVGVAPTIVLVSANLFFFNTKYKAYKPSIKFVRKEYAKDIMKLGVKFFVLQISAMIQFETGLFLIAFFFGTKEVTNYNIAFKYFSVLQMGFSILLSPFWSGVTDAYNKGEVEWIKNAIKKYLLILVPFIITGLIMLAASDKIYDLWVGKKLIHIDFRISMLCLIYFSTGMFASIFVSVINGIGALRLQFISAVVGSVCFFLLSVTFIKVFHMGMQSILLSSIITNVFGYIIAPIQVYNIFYKKSEARIWYR